jgi:hypothetical protein
MFPSSNLAYFLGNLLDGSMETYQRSHHSLSQSRVGIASFALACGRSRTRCGLDVLDLLCSCFLSLDNLEHQIEHFNTCLTASTTPVATVTWNLVLRKGGVQSVREFMSNLCKRFHTPGTKPVHNATVEQGRRCGAPVGKIGRRWVHREDNMQIALNQLCELTPQFVIQIKKQTFPLVEAFPVRHRFDSLREICILLLNVAYLNWDSNCVRSSPSNKPGTSPEANKAFILSKKALDKTFDSSKMKQIFSPSMQTLLNKFFKSSSKSRVVYLLFALIWKTLNPFIQATNLLRTVLPTPDSPTSSM